MTPLSQRPCSHSASCLHPAKLFFLIQDPAQDAAHAQGPEGLVSSPLAPLSVSPPSRLHFLSSAGSYLVEPSPWAWVSLGSAPERGSASSKEIPQERGPQCFPVGSTVSGGLALGAETQLAWTRGVSPPGGHPFRLVILLLVKLTPTN